MLKNDASFLPRIFQFCAITKFVLQFEVHISQCLPHNLSWASYNIKTPKFSSKSICVYVRWIYQFWLVYTIALAKFNFIAILFIQKYLYFIVVNMYVIGVIYGHH